ncbi:MAG: 3'(2'),5'-bisphosphate nucleotidase [Candidatus Muproteobacteria bacterium RIFCSPHIGHO2_01_FULL_65_16]|uniref:3'(2'),5'-bisphosphate nucleotidase CysQ n=1 Tax=Candidatus Muproteobacteria bacterium RIFCSPHIGHO2_01_FULL_65_16 TaxID=1817764 RepID=A0A1F6TJ35_9PROT|nr:MAG: 3'(2'),5'-bisphosphate nucleotidase [Candidatus Muproteobacteria bacterium RIFCSPHIGHO2_01_FULL_65_16]
MSRNPCDWLEEARAIAVEAGRRILDVYERNFHVGAKADGSPLTEADRAAHDAIVARLSALTPDVPVLSEEATQVPYEARAAWGRFWLVDPLDGTKEFINRNGEFTVNIALIEGHAPVLGVVYVPVLGVGYSACRGGGAFRQKADGRPEPIRARRFAGGKPVVVASRSHAGRETEEFLQSLGAHDVVSMGSSLKFCLVADGAADVYPRLGPTMEWDTAAAQCVVEEAGGGVTDLTGRPLAYNKPDLHNPWFIVRGAGEYDWRRHLPPAAK